MQRYSSRFGRGNGKSRGFEGPETRNEITGAACFALAGNYTTCICMKNPATDGPVHRRFAPTALMLGNIVTGCSVLAPAGMLSELSGDAERIVEWTWRYDS
jgi:hypothetical protein